MAQDDRKNRQKKDYGFCLEYRTRWSDNDIRNPRTALPAFSVKRFRFDSIVNTYLMECCGLHPPTSDQIGLVVHSSCDYFAPVGFPAVVELGLRVKKLGKSSVTYEIGVFERFQKDVKAIGEFVHVFVDRETRRPRPDGMGASMKEGLQKLTVGGKDSKL
ncbi:MAG: hypothetical protein M1822_003341 [Bathelium mastoideum]|nr:MAG: hypothetical protein M1822_003341 [Bathelium mastoideum]